MTGNAKPMEDLFRAAQELLDAGKDNEDIRKTLESTGVDSATLDAVLHQIRSLRYLRRRKRGFLIGAIGSGILIIGFFLTVFLFHSGSNFNAVMYGMTSVGVLLLMIGMVEIMGW